MLTPNYNSQERRVEDEANASYMSELNQRMDKQLGNQVIAQVEQEDARSQHFLNSLKGLQ